MAEVTQLKRYDAPRINWGKWFLIGVGRAGVRPHPCGADAVHLRSGVQQGADARAGEPGESGHAACHLADGD